jgi:hypothetical protein
VLHEHLLHEPRDTGHSYHKPLRFLWVALASSELTFSEITERVELAKRHVLQRPDQIYLAYGGDTQSIKRLDNLETRDSKSECT